MTSVCLYKVACLHCNNVPEVYSTALHGTKAFNLGVAQARQSSEGATFVSDCLKLTDV